MILIDPEGRSAPGDAVAHKVRGASSRAPDGDYTGHAVRHLGYVEMQPMRAGAGNIATIPTSAPSRTISNMRGLPNSARNCRS